MVLVFELNPHLTWYYSFSYCFPINLAKILERGVLPTTKQWVEAVLHSYSQLFFSLDQRFGLMLLVASFFDIRLGFAGFLSVVFSNFVAFLFQLNLKAFAHGLYGYNALLTGLALAFDWNNGLFFLPVLFLGSAASLLTTLLVNSIFDKWNLPSLSIPFVATIWIMTVFLRESEVLPSMTHSLYVFDNNLLDLRSFEKQLHSSLPTSIRVLLNTYSGIFFISSPAAGLLIAFGLLIWSRIAFVFTTVVLLSAYFLFSSALGPEAWLNYQCGSNFIFLALSVGCFYTVPSLGSLLASIVLVPFTLLVHVFLGGVGGLFLLPVYTLAFTASTHMFLTLIRQWGRLNWIIPIEIQHYSPEASVYRTSFFTQRLKNIGKLHFKLPYLGEWLVSQGYRGDFTHKGDWSSALDFIILDSEMKAFQRSGTKVEDYFCFNKPVLAPAGGYVEEVVNHIEENPIAGMDIRQNWGNTVVINHGNGYFSQLSHLKKESIKVVVGQYVKEGEIVGTCGNSGRSPEPHLHFQLQREGKVGSKTASYPIAYYMSNKQGKYVLNEFSIPKEGEIIANVELNPSLVSAFTLLPGSKLEFSDEQGDKVKWEVFTDAWNRSYIYCHKTGGYAYFVNDGTMFYFTDFEGSKDSLLYVFYLAAYKVLLGSYPGLNLEDRYSLQYVSNPVARVLQDFAAPFVTIAKAKFLLRYPDFIHHLESKRIVLQSEMELSLWSYSLSKRNLTIDVEEGKIVSIGMAHDGKQKNWKRIDK